MKKITKEELQAAYYQNTNEKVAKEFGISLPTLTSYLRQFEIPLKGKGRAKGQTKIKFIG